MKTTKVQSNVLGTDTSSSGIVMDSPIDIDEVLIDLSELTSEFGAVRLKLPGNLTLEEVVTEEGTELIVTKTCGTFAN